MLEMQTIIKERILELYNNDGLRYDMGKEGRRLVEAGYDWEKIVERMEMVLLAVAGKREAL